MHTRPSAQRALKLHRELLQFSCAYLQDFSTLDAGLQQAFVSYLEERGIDAAMGEYLMSVHEVKEQKEYVNWLARIEKFLVRK